MFYFIQLLPPGRYQWVNLTIFSSALAKEGVYDKIHFCTIFYLITSKAFYNTLPSGAFISTLNIAICYFF